MGAKGSKGRQKETKGSKGARGNKGKPIEAKGELLKTKENYWNKLKQIEANRNQ